MAIKRFILGAAFVLCGVGQLAAGVTQKTTYIYFPVQGASAAAIYRSITAHSELKDTEHTLATNKVHMDTQILTRNGKPCRVARVTVAMKFAIYLPRLENEASLMPPLRRDWRAFAAHLRAHELHHSAIWMTCAAGYNRALSKLLGGDCDNLTRQMNARWTEAETSCRKPNDDFDDRDENGMLTMPFIRRVSGGR